MSTNNYRPHVHLFPEDRANSQIANGFSLALAPSYQAIQILDEAGGWMAALNLFESDLVRGMITYPLRHLVLLIDFDNAFGERIKYIKTKIPQELTERVFVLGSLSEPEDLRAHLGSYETIGIGLARDCRDSTNVIWGHALLRHNADELDRLRRAVRTFLFP